MRQQVVGEIKSNQSLESDLNQMDIKIGLLVKNRITLQVHMLPTLLVYFLSICQTKSYHHLKLYPPFLCPLLPILNFLSGHRENM